MSGLDVSSKSMVPDRQVFKVVFARGLTLSFQNPNSNEVVAGSKEKVLDNHYKDRVLVDLYDAVNASRSDFDFYLARLPSPPCDVLDIGCGTGTFTIEMATLGYRVTGVDPASAMIAAARAKPGAHQVSWIAGTISDVPRSLVFDAAVMTGHAFQCLLNDADIETLFCAMSDRLADDGSFWFETRNPQVEPWKRWMPEFAGRPISLPDGRTVEITHRVLSVTGSYVSFEETYLISDQDGALISQSRLRFPTLSQISGLADRCGLTVVETYGDWQGQALTDTSPEIILRLMRSG